MVLVTNPNVAAFTEPGFGRQRAIRSGRGLPTQTFTTCETAPVRERESRTVGCLRNLS